MIDAVLADKRQSTWVHLKEAQGPGGQRTSQALFGKVAESDPGLNMSGVLGGIKGVLATADDPRCLK